MIKEALYFEKLPEDKVRCRLCPQECIIYPDKVGFCGIRKNRDGILYSQVYGDVTAMALDPIEKKPLYRYHPGEYILSISTKGCNFKCPFCQNWNISQDLDADARQFRPDDIVREAKRAGSFGIAYTYNEPFIWYEFVFDTAKLAKEAGLENALVTNGYVNELPLLDIIPYIGAMNVDLKAASEDFYKNICKGKLQPVLNTIKSSRQNGVHIELTNLVIPTLNDSEELLTKLVDLVYENAGPDVPMHFSRYFPCYKADYPPTPEATLELAKKIATKKLKYVYIGNI